MAKLIETLNVNEAPVCSTFDSHIRLAVIILIASAPLAVVKVIVSETEKVLNMQSVATPVDIFTGANLSPNSFARVPCAASIH